MNKRNIFVGFVVLVLLAVVSASVFAMAGSGTLTAQGDGRAKVRGNGEVTFTVNGKTVIKDFQLSDAAINVECEGIEKEVVIEGNIRKYVCAGTATGTVSGENFGVKLTGLDIDLTATGTGIARLWGQGTWQFGDNSGEWNEVGTKFKLSE